MASQHRDLYELVGVTRDAGTEEIRKAYREKAKQLHPDRNPRATAAEEFKCLAEAYRVLADCKRRGTHMISAPMAAWVGDACVFADGWSRWFVDFGVWRRHPCQHPPRTYHHSVVRSLWNHQPKLHGHRGCTAPLSRALWQRGERLYLNVLRLRALQLQHIGWRPGVRCACF